ncbi:MAG: three-Cys-motif partner protein TcmP [Desulfurivibrionaceae bacterium]|jgi:three-Cys-motif partner protein
MSDIKYDEIGYWSEVKLDILREYASTYSRILSVQKNPRLYHLYIDAFAGAGKHKSKMTGEFIPGSPTNALLVSPPFKEYHLVDLNEKKAELLEDLAGGRADISVYNGDCNEILLKSIFPKASYRNYKRALCILDPYGLHLDWDIMHTAGKMRSIEIFLNFPVADMNRNVLWRDPQSVPESQIDRMNTFWGDDSWKSVAYHPSPQGSLWGEEKIDKATNDQIAAAFQKRLKEVAGFGYVPDPLPMRNSQNAIVYYLFFASHKPVAAKIVTEIFKKYQHYMVH